MRRPLCLAMLGFVAAVRVITWIKPDVYKRQPLLSGLHFRPGNANLTEGEELNCYEETASYVKIPERILRSYDRRPI